MIKYSGMYVHMPGVRSDTRHWRAKHRIQLIIQCTLIYLSIQCTFIWYQMGCTANYVKKKYEIVL